MRTDRRTGGHKRRRPSLPRSRIGLPPQPLDCDTVRPSCDALRVRAGGVPGGRAADSELLGVQAGAVVPCRVCALLAASACTPVYVACSSRELMVIEVTPPPRGRLALGALVCRAAKDPVRYKAPPFSTGTVQCVCAHRHLDPVPSDCVLRSQGACCVLPVGELGRNRRVIEGSGSARATQYARHPAHARAAPSSGGFKACRPRSPHAPCCSTQLRAAGRRGRRSSAAAWPAGG